MFWLEEKFKKYFYKLTNNLFRLENNLNNVFIAWQEKLPWFIIKVTSASYSKFIINSKKQELTHHIHCLGYICYHQSIIIFFFFFFFFWFCRFITMLLHFLSILFIKCLNSFLFNKTSLHLLWLFLTTEYLIASFLSLCSMLSSTKKEYI